MNFKRLFVIVALLAAVPRSAAADLAPSLQALFSDGDCEAVPGLLGDWNWTHGNLSGTWTIQKLDDSRFRLISHNEENKDQDTGNMPAFDICVAHLGTQLFFDATWQAISPNGKQVLDRNGSPFWIPLHLIGRLKIEEGALHFELLEDDWLQSMLKSGRITVTNAPDDAGGSYMLTAPSAELKAFVLTFATDPEAFSYEEEFERVPDEKTN